MDVKGEAVNSTNFKQIHKSLDWQLVDKLGDYYKVLNIKGKTHTQKQGYTTN